MLSCLFGWQELEVDESMNNKPMPKKQSIQLSECLELFTTTELLGEHDLWYCLLSIHRPSHMGTVMLSSF